MHPGRSIMQGWAGVASRPGMAALALISLCLAVYLPGFVRLPAVDRTEIIYAESTRDMVARGDWQDPRYGEAVHQYRPIGTFWAQGASRTLLGESLSRDIRVYRLPSLIAVTLSVLAVFWLGQALVGVEAALIAAALFAVAPLTVLVSQLAIAEGLSLLPATIAMLTLARIYTNPASPREREETRAEQRPIAPSIAATLTPPRNELQFAMIFWIALGFGVLINALLVPIIVLVTLIGLFLMDRDLRWMKRLHPLYGLPVALIIASPWLIVRAHQDGTPFAGLNWREFLGALGGAQDMKLRAMPGTFLLAVVLGFLPGTALLGSAFVRLWEGRSEQRLARFLFAWIIGYIIYLEALSSKPGTYMVQTMFPALALAVALVVVSEKGDGRKIAWSAFPWPTSLSILPLGIFGAVYLFAGEWPSLLVAFLIMIIVWLFLLSAQQGREGRLRRWAKTGVAALGLLAVTLLGVVLPSIAKIWPAEQLAHAVAACPESKIGLVGFREPSGRFVLGVPTDQQTPDAIASGVAEKSPRLTIIEDRWRDRTSEALQAKAQSPLPQAAACVSVYNVMRGCPLHFRIYETSTGQPCTFPADLACDVNPAPAGPQKSGDCD